MARCHRELDVGAQISARFPARSPDAPGRGWRPAPLERVLMGAGFADLLITHEVTGGGSGRLRVDAHRAFSLADTVGPGMRLLVCGLNPSPHAAASGVPYSRPGNRFWPAALRAGIVTIDRDPIDALTSHGIGITDLVKRATRSASELDREEFRQGLERVRWLVRWLQPAAVCLVGLTGWRQATGHAAAAGSVGRLGGRPVWLMPSTSGRNAHADLAGLADHLRRAADQSATA